MKDFVLPTEFCCRQMELGNNRHSPECEVEILLRGEPLENSSTVCVHCSGPIVLPVKNSFCSWSCYISETDSVLD